MSETHALYLISKLLFNLQYCHNLFLKLTEFHKKTISSIYTPGSRSGNSMLKDEIKIYKYTKNKIMQTFCIQD